MSNAAVEKALPKAGTRREPESDRRITRPRGVAEFEDLYRRHGRALFRYALARTFGDTHLAEDIVQETFLRAWRTPGVVGARTESCRAWLVTVARNLVIDRLRNRDRRPRETGDGVLPQIPVQQCETDRVVMSLALRQAMASLTPRRREILIEVYLQDRSLKQVSEALGVPIGTVKSRAHAALRALRGELDAPELCVA
jgi:RNA polymerase sigma-70 factor (ECF subfamily)